MGNSFGYAPEPVMRRLLRRLGAAAKPGGWLVLNTGVLAETLLPTLKTTAEYQTGAVLMRICNRYHPLLSVLESELTFVRGEKREVKTAFHHVFTLAEVGRMLRAAGFGLTEACGGPDGRPYAVGDYASGKPPVTEGLTHGQPGSPRLAVVVRKIFLN